MKGVTGAARPPMVPSAQAHAAAARPPLPRSCDTFVALPDSTTDGSVVFGKNSDRETEEVQEVVVFAAAQHPPSSIVRCTYIEVPQVPRTLAVVLSRPTWMWGAEMGANEKGVVCGNEAVWTVEPSDGDQALLGMDLVRLALERGSTAAEAVDVITSLLEEHGQGGPCEEEGSWSYHNGFLVADHREAWVLETAGKWWVAQRITKGVRNISNVLSIRTDFQRCSSGLQDHARQQGYWDGKGQFDWAAAFADGGAPPLGKLNSGREATGFKLLQGAAPAIDPAAMMHILRDRPSGICMTGGGFRSNGSQVSRLSPPAGAAAAAADGHEGGNGIGVQDGSRAPAQHWFTATPDPSRSVFKPFSFASSSAPGGSNHTVALPARRNPPHVLWQAWQAAHEGRHGGGSKPSQAALRELEQRGLDASSGLTFAEAVDEELRLYGRAPA